MSHPMVVVISSTAFIIYFIFRYDCVNLFSGIFLCKTMKTVFLSYTRHIHHVHRSFAQEIGAAIKIMPFTGYIKLITKYPFLNCFFPLMSYLYALVSHIDADILISDGGSCLYAASMLKLKYPRLIVIHLDGDLFFYSLGKTRFTTAGFALKKIDAVLSVSEQNRKQVRRFLDVPAVVCPPYPQAVAKRNIPRRKYGLYVGRLSPEKNIARLIAFGLQCPHIEKFVLVGDGVLDKYVENKARKYDKIIYAGPQRDVGRYYSECTFLLHLPDIDAHPVTCMEAALCGCYPVLSAGVGARYLFDSLFIAENPDDFTHINEKMAWILDNPLAADESLEKSLQFIPDRITSLENFRKAFELLLKQIAERPQAL
ncbi:MAG: glycosyltransferase [Chitinivibrionales bacterium]|nr:glycosyltransferase [Chitinivibrionales bacterium]